MGDFSFGDFVTAIGLAFVVEGLMFLAFPEPVRPDPGFRLLPLPSKPGWGSEAGGFSARRRTRQSRDLISARGGSGPGQSCRGKGRPGKSCAGKSCAGKSCDGTSCAGSFRAGDVRSARAARPGDHPSTPRADGARRAAAARAGAARAIVLTRGGVLEIHCAIRITGRRLVMWREWATFPSVIS